METPESTKRVAKVGSEGAPARKKKRKGPPKAPAPPPPTAGGKTKLVIGLGVALAALALVVFLLSRGGGGFSEGSEVDVEITLVAADAKNLACASAESVAGKQCAVEAPDKPRPGAPSPPDPSLLMPYTTTQRRQFLASGLWAEEAMKGPLPAERFTVKCKLKVEGKVASPSVRWAAEGPWYPTEEIWPAGSLSGCSRAGS